MKNDFRTSLLTIVPKKRTFAASFIFCRDMRVFKFGGVSVVNPEAVRHIARLIEENYTEPTVVVISAMGKMTNALEKLYQSSLKRKTVSIETFESVKDFHLNIIRELFPFGQPQLEKDVFTLFHTMEKQLKKSIVHPSVYIDYKVYDFFYDQIVSIGELLSTKIMAAYLTHCGLPVVWCDARKLIRTNNMFREGKVRWDTTVKNIKNRVPPLLDEGKLVLTQGFIGGNRNVTTTLGREGSDYSAAVFSFALDASEMIIWKDVDGVLNADPKFFSDTKVLKYIPYEEAIELAYYGATVIHPKTIKPLENKNIPLRVKSFLNPKTEGSLIMRTPTVKPSIPSYIVKRNQVLVSISPKDFSFIAEDKLSMIYGLFATLGMKSNLMQNSALSLCICVDNQPLKLTILKEKLHREFCVSIHRNLELITVRRFTEEVIHSVVEGRIIVVEQRNKNTAQLVVPSLSDQFQNNR